MQRREAELSRGQHILSTAPPDGPAQVRGGMSSRGPPKTGRRSVSRTPSMAPPPRGNDVELDLNISAPAQVDSYADYSQPMAMSQRSRQPSYRSQRSASRSVYDVGQYSARSGRSGRQSARSGASGRQSARSQYTASEYEESEAGEDYTNSFGLIGSKSKPDPGQPYLLASGSPTKAHVIAGAYGRYEEDIKRRQGAADKLDKEAQDRQRLQQQVEILKSEQKRREQQEMKRMLAKQVVERQKKREEERREKLVPYDLTHVLPLERERDFFQEYAEKQGMKRALFKQMEEKKNIKQRELDRERAMDLESKEALASSLAKEHALNTYTRMNAGNMLRDNWAKQIRLHNVQRRIDGDHYAAEPVGKRG